MPRPRSGVITLTSKEDVDPQPHILKKRFPLAYVSKGDRITLKSLSMNYSWNNVTEALGNTGGCSYRWTDGVVYNVPYPAGYYPIADLNGFLRDAMIANHHYLRDENGDPVYYLSFETNQIYYRVTLTSRPTPSALPTGWTNPGGPENVNGLAPQLVIQPAPNMWGNLIGYTAGSYPATQGSALTQFNGSLPPQISPITNVNVTCNWCWDNRFDKRPNVLASFVPDVQYGAVISYQPPVLTWMDVTENIYQEIEIGFFDQNWNPLQILDINQIQVNLALETEI